jgi:hypothetical protein
MSHVAFRITLLIFAVLLSSPAHAQLSTQHVKGGTGLKSGSAPPPGGYLVLPLVYVYNTDTVRDRDGDKLAGDADLTVSFFGAGYARTMEKKVLGGHYGFSFLIAGANNRIQGTEIDSNPGAGWTDAVVTPAQIGWRFKQADAVVQYNLFVPVGRYTDGASDNTGLGMWGQELAFGTTVYLNEARKYHAATVASFNFQSTKADSETKVGNAMNLEGGFGGDFLGGRLTTGLVYYASFKLTADQIEGFPLNIEHGKSKVFAIGPEVSFPLERNGVLYGFLKANYQWEAYARATTQGREFNIVATFLVTPLKLPKP